MLTGLANDFSVYWFSFYWAWHNYHFRWSLSLLPKPKLFLYFFILSFLLKVVFPLILNPVSSYQRDFWQIQKDNKKIKTIHNPITQRWTFKSNFLPNFSYAYVCAWPSLHKLGCIYMFSCFLQSKWNLSLAFSHPSRGYYI